jgi:tetratricopeptide (TPR) repeat protein
VQVPDRIQGLLMSSIDSLPGPAREVLRTASVVGTSFERSILRGILRGTTEERSLDGILRSLVEQSLVERYPTAPGGVFRFRHALIQEVAYDSLMFSKRRRLHRTIGEYLESANAADLEPVYESLAHHYSAGRDDDKTLRFSVLAAGKAHKLYAHPEAVAFYRDAMKAVRARTPEAAAIRSLLDERIGETYETAGRATEAARAFRDSLQRWRRARRPTGTAGLRLPVIEGLTEDIVLDGRDAELCHRIGLAYARTHYYYDQALRWLDRAMESLPRGRPSLRAKISVAESGVWYRKGDYERALEWGRLGLKTARLAGSLDVQAYALTILGSGYCDLGKLRLAVQRDAAALALYEELGDLSGQAIGQNHMGASLMLLGRFDEALEHYRTALGMFARMGNGKEVALVAGNIGELHVARGDFEPALEHLRSALDACDRLPAAYLIEEGARLNLARAHQGLLHYDEAAAELRRTASLVTKSGVPADVVEVMLQQADLELEVGNLPDALRTCGDALKAADRLGHRQYVSRANRILGRIAHAQGDQTRAEALITDSAAEAERIGAQWERGLALLALAELYADWSDPAARRTPFKRTVRQAINVLEGVGARAAAENARALAAAHA